VINHSGGGSASDLWCQIRADILDRPLQRIKMRDAGVLGAALLAGTGVAVFSSLKQAASTFVKVDREFQPNRHEVARHTIAFERFKSLYHQVKEWNV
jgi:xylulokinase